MSKPVLVDALNFVINVTIEQQELGETGDAEYISKGESIIDRALKEELVRPISGTPYVAVIEDTEEQSTDALISLASLTNWMLGHTGPKDTCHEALCDAVRVLIQSGATKNPDGTWSTN